MKEEEVAIVLEKLVVNFKKGTLYYSMAPYTKIGSRAPYEYKQVADEFLSAEEMDRRIFPLFKNIMEGSAYILYRCKNKEHYAILKTKMYKNARYKDKELTIDIVKDLYQYFKKALKTKVELHKKYHLIFESTKKEDPRSIQWESFEGLYVTVPRQSRGRLKANYEGTPNINNAKEFTAVDYLFVQLEVQKITSGLLKVVAIEIEKTE